MLVVAMGTPAPHGFALTPEDRLLLRSPPPAPALAWCTAAVGPGARLGRVEALDGGTSSAVHAVDVESASGAVHRLVLRRFVRADWLAEEPDTARREAAALALLGGSPVPAPALVAVDPEGSAAGAPAVLMTRLAGVPAPLAAVGTGRGVDPKAFYSALRWRPRDLDRFLRALAEALPAVHAVALPEGGAIPRYEPYSLTVDRPPPWTRRPGVWERAFAAFAGPPPDRERRFIHRDYHPGNVLWSGGALSGIVDWVNASAGSPGADVGHCRMNLAGAIGLEAADRFAALHRSASGLDVRHPYWDIVAALGGFDDDDVAGWTPRDEEFLARAVAEV